MGVHDHVVRSRATTWGKPVGPVKAGLYYTMSVDICLEDKWFSLLNDWEGLSGAFEII